MSSKPRHRRTHDHCRRWGATGTGVGIAVGGAMAAAFVSMGTASADDALAAGTDDVAFTELAPTTDPNAVTDPFTDPTPFAAAAVPAQAGTEDAVTQLLQTTDPSALTVDAVPAQAAAEAAVTQLTQTIDPSAVTAAAVTQLTQTIDPSAVTAAAVPAATLDAWEQLVLTIDPSAFDATGNPTDFLGTIAVQIDTDLATTAFGPELNTIAGQVSCLIAVPPTCTDVITPPTTGDNGFTVLEQFLTQTYFPTALPLAFDPVLVADLNTIASDLDAYFAPTVWGPEIFTIATQIVAGL
jgi:hypothetical protein